MKLLLIKDEKDLRDSIVSYLQGELYLCETASDFSTALEKIEVYDYDCILLDIMLPGGSGLKLLEFLRTDKKTDGVIIISAKESLDDKIAGLNLGADDYLAKPFHLAELSARISSVIRRKNFEGHNFLELGEIVIDIEAKSASVHNKPLELTPKEYELLLFFVANKDKVGS